MNSKNINRQLYVLPAILSLWLIASSALLAWIDPSYFLYLIPFLLFACVLCLSHTLRVLGWIVALLGAGLYFLLHFSINGVTGDGIRIVSLGVFSIVGAAVFCTFIAEQLHQIDMQVRYSRKMIEELRIVDPVSGLIRFHYARKNLNTEVARCQRYNKYLSLLIARVSKWNEVVDARGVDASQHIMMQVGEQFSRSIRNVDIAFINIEKIGVILPETKLEGAVQVAHRIVENCLKKAKIEINIGIATFPNDATLDTDLIRCAESALQISMSSGQPIVLYSQIQGAIDDTAADSALARRSPSMTEGTDRNLEEQMILQVLPPYRDDSMPAGGDESADATQTWIDADVQEFRSGTGSGGAAPFEGAFPPSEVVAAQGPDLPPAGLQMDKTDWVKPYRPPVSNLRLESMEEGGVGKSIEMQEILIGIHGVEKISSLPEIERALNELRSVSRVSMVDFTEQTLVLRLDHTSDNILEEIQSDLKLPYEEVRNGSEWIEISLKG